MLAIAFGEALGTGKRELDAYHGPHDVQARREAFPGMRITFADPGWSGARDRRLGQQKGACLLPPWAADTGFGARAIWLGEDLNVS
jgi:hypothetical protein